MFKCEDFECILVVTASMQNHDFLLLSRLLVVSLKGVDVKCKGCTYSKYYVWLYRFRSLEQNCMQIFGFASNSKQGIRLSHQSPTSKVKFKFLHKSYIVHSKYCAHTSHMYGFSKFTQGKNVYVCVYVFKCMFAQCHYYYYITITNIET